MAQNPYIDPAISAPESNTNTGKEVEIDMSKIGPDTYAYTGVDMGIDTDVEVDLDTHPVTPEEVRMVLQARKQAMASLPEEAPDHLIVSVADRWSDSEGGKVLTIAGLSRAQVYLLSRILSEEAMQTRRLELWGAGPSQLGDPEGHAKARGQYQELLNLAGTLLRAIR